MSFYFTSTSHLKSVALHDVETALRNANLISEDASLESLYTPCYCEDGDYCNCLPESFSFGWDTIDPNKCMTCGASGQDFCKTRSGKRASFHKARKNIE
jgi:hypothetical protein